MIKRTHYWYIALATASMLIAPSVQAINCQGIVARFLNKKPPPENRYSETWNSLEQQFQNKKLLGRNKINFLLQDLQKQKKWTEWELAAYLDFLFFHASPYYKPRIKALNSKISFAWKTKTPKTQVELEQSIVDLTQGLYELYAMQKFSELRRWPMTSKRSIGSWPWGDESLANQWLRQIEPEHRTALKALTRIKVPLKFLPSRDEMNGIVKIALKGFWFLYRAPNPVSTHTLSQSLRPDRHYQRALGFYWLASKSAHVMVASGMVSTMVATINTDWEELFATIGDAWQRFQGLDHMGDLLLDNQQEIYDEAQRLRREEIGKIEAQASKARSTGNLDEAERLQRYLDLQNRRLED